MIAHTPVCIISGLGVLDGERVTLCLARGVGTCAPDPESELTHAAWFRPEH